MHRLRYRSNKLRDVAPAGIGHPPISILVVEDSRSVRELLCGFLRQLPELSVEAASNLAEARQLLAHDSRRFFCAALDLHLPDAPGGEVVDFVLAAGVPVIVLTASADQPTRAQMLSRPIVDYVIKRDAHEIEHVAYLVGRLRENCRTKVLICDDSPSFRLYLVTLLERYRYVTVQATDGAEALEMLAAHPDVSLVITDMYMPRMDGLQLIAHIREKHRREELAVIGVSEASDSQLISAMLKTGANDFLAKPFEVEHFYCRVTQSANAVSLVRRLRDAATRDYLTGAYNRRHFFEIAGTLYANAARGNILIATAIIDVDHFKRINDSFGHAAGDQALRLLAATLRSSLRATDVVGRHGGEEFACIAVIARVEDAEPLFQRLRQQIERTPLEVAGQQIRLTVSIGVTTTLAGSVDAMLQQADQALYTAKEAGRNRVVQA